MRTASHHNGKDLAKEIAVLKSQLEDLAEQMSGTGQSLASRGEEAIEETLKSARALIAKYGDTAKSVAQETVNLKNKAADTLIEHTEARPLTTLAAIVGIGAMLLMVPKWGVLGCAVAYLIQYLFMVAVTFVVTRRLLPFPIPWGDIGRTVLATLAMVVVLLVARGTLEHLPTAIDLAASIVLGIATYVGAALVLRPSPVEDLVPARFRRDKA